MDASMTTPSMDNASGSRNLMTVMMMIMIVVITVIVRWGR